MRTSRREGSNEKRKVSLSPETTVKAPKIEESPDPLRLLMQRSNSGGLGLALAKRLSLGGGPGTATGLASDNPYNQFTTAVSQTSLRRTQTKGHLEGDETRRKRERSSLHKDKPHMFSQKEMFRNLKRVRTAEKQQEASRRKGSLRPKLSSKHERDSLRLSKERSRSSILRGAEGGSSVRTGSNLDDLLPSLPSEDARDLARTAYPS